MVEHQASEGATGSFFFTFKNNQTFFSRALTKTLVIFAKTKGAAEMAQTQTAEAPVFDAYSSEQKVADLPPLNMSIFFLANIFLHTRLRFRLVGGKHLVCGCVCVCTLQEVTSGF